MNVQVNVIYTP